MMACLHATAPPHHHGEVCQSTELPPGHADLQQLPCERDQVFGASWNAISVKWSGVWQCNPEYDEHDGEGCQMHGR
jgi:hypothetical protein